MQRIKNQLFFLRKNDFKNSPNYWEERYAKGGNSGNGSYGKYATFKAKTINDFLKDEKIANVIEFGCGDGNVLSLINYPNYLGIDVSETAIEYCMRKFANDPTKHFQISGGNLPQADLTVSLDVIFHLVEDQVYNNYMKMLFETSKKHVIIYSSNMEDNNNNSAHYKDRKFTEWINNNQPDWKLIKVIKNPIKKCPVDFYFYKKKD